MNTKANKATQFTNDKKNPFSIAFNDVLSIRQDAAKGIWIGTDGGGVSYYNKRRNNFMLFSNKTIPSPIEIAPVRSITTDKTGVIWAGTSSKGLTKIDYQNGQYKTWQFPSFNKNVSNPNRIVSLFAETENRLWCGTQGNGIIIFDPRKESVITWYHPEADAKQKIPDATAWCFFVASENEIWVGTESKGLCLFDKQKGYIGNYTTVNKSGIADAVRSIIQIDDSTLCVGFGKTGLQLFNTRSKTFFGLQSKFS